MANVSLTTGLLLVFSVISLAYCQRDCNTNNDCRHGGTCNVHDTTTSTCSCTQLWTGNTCQLCAMDAACNNGTCSSGICICPPGITTTDCSISPANGCGEFPVGRFVIATVASAILLWHGI